VGRPDLSICIVNWNTRELLRACLRSIHEQPPQVSHEILVADNASRDGSAAMVAAHFPDVRLFANRANLGYAEGNNQLMRAARGRHWLLLNSDTEVDPQRDPRPFDTLVAHLDAHPFVGAVAAKLVHPDGRTQRSCRGWPTPASLAAEWSGLARLCPTLFGAYRLRDFDHETFRPVPQPMASCLLLRRAAMQQVGLFDPQFRIFFNDVDLCRRIWQNGWRIDYQPAATIVHHGGASTRQVRREMIVESRDALLAYFAKHRGRNAGEASDVLVRQALRLVFGCRAWRAR
jgi:hypothetical protein